MPIRRSILTRSPALLRVRRAVTRRLLLDEQRSPTRCPHWAKGSPPGPLLLIMLMPSPKPSHGSNLTNAPGSLARPNGSEPLRRVPHQKNSRNCCSNVPGNSPAMMASPGSNANAATSTYAGGSTRTPACSTSTANSTPNQGPRSPAEYDARSKHSSTTRSPTPAQPTTANKTTSAPSPSSTSPKTKPAERHRRIVPISSLSSTLKH